MKKMFCMLLAFAMLFALSACAAPKTDQEYERQIAAARLDQDGNDVDVIIDVSGGWSVEFVAGAFYLYDKPYSEEKTAVAVGMTLEQDVFEDHLAEARASDSCREANGAIYYKDEGGRDTCLLTVGDDAYLMVRLEYVGDGSAVFSRIKSERGMNHIPVAWSRDGYFESENGYELSVYNMSDVDAPDWYVGCMLGEDYTEDSWSGSVIQVGNVLQGVLSSSSAKEDISVTIFEDAESGLMLAVDGGETYQFSPVELPEATIQVTINTDGRGMIDHAEGDEAPEIDVEYPYQTAYIGLDEPKLYTFAAAPEEGSVFIKWTRNGEDYSTESVITLTLDESAEYIAVFEDAAA